MKMDGLNKWLTLIANMGVLAGVIFLGIETNQNTRSFEASAYRDLTDRLIEINSSNVNRLELIPDEVTEAVFEGLSAG
jgi:hypothetical protein